MSEDALPPLLLSLSGGDRRSIGRVADAVEAVLTDPALLATLFEGMQRPDPVLRMRCADAAEKISARQPQWLLPFRDQLLDGLAADPQQEIRWHVAPMLLRLPLSTAEADRVYAILVGYTADPSRIVRTEAMQALADLARRHPRFTDEVRRLLTALAASGTPAMQARGRRLLARLNAA
ncbi:MAG TPA: hypothetical protein PLN96_17725 [Zoogloea sp.]|uniref:hypothetical protein n=1 Tax=Zoogloea sp. TaxID=49181 RepID=UPI002B83F599|nr:hypothetical protein [Zoogloea sp.]HMV18559.1 hypothetical protein [Rhodocyclaceae bacterium]HMV65037.1 hypothetical protein [Rhodocyclaceae bacterium]HMW53797.1 hypothetical protein [Rhodocyclaceae bacterium]HMZ75256.1 hypothetical protein [Rhodocyclaceae bacterium]HNA69374.1 hypothetical protein [Rhodocyclaceae bacterium]